MQVIYKFILVIALILISGCTVEEDFSSFNLEIKNETGQNITLEFYETSIINNSNSAILAYTEELNASGSYLCNYRFSSFVGLKACRNRADVDIINRIIIRFENNKGYLCDSLGDSMTCFDGDRAFFLGTSLGWASLNDNNYTFTITQQDFDNAFDLP
ncbi:hypothetical protein DDD_2203 [Nonlabens dokdonensis DSW-6]|uniref:Lipoprotein n=1 Tax=Nonlabens dokdonensis (strain DSM 17205 / KCTC 12402 / DSW-6) TaxID=592029 RepID=L7W6P0_NONDD|nr:hypothetical protein DDD_2203 [Nonlabens dokdonensis DSW-6]